MSQATLSATTLADPIQTFGQLGGQGLISNKALAIPVHLAGPWSSLEYVVLSPSAAESPTQVGEHVQNRTDEIYFVVSGTGRLTTNGISETVGRGDLVVAPQGTRHSISNRSSQHPLAFLVVELLPTCSEENHPPMLIRNLFGGLEDEVTFHGMNGSFQVARVDLAPHFAAPWGELSLLRLPPGERVGPYVVANADELLFVLNVEDGCATIIAGGHEFCSHTKGLGELQALPGEGLSVVVPAGMSRSVRNDHSGIRHTLDILSLEVRRTGVPLASGGCVYEEARA